MNNLTRERSLRLRGAAIFIIYIHNLLHMVARVKENEFFFSPVRAERMVDALSSFSHSFLADFFSYFGWYGVPVFMFLSGYGLVMKHESSSPACDPAERQGKSLQAVPFLWKNFLKLFVLMAPCYFIYILGTGLPFFSKMTLAQFAMMSNLYRPSMITPGVYWYFGLTLQFYLIYLLLYRFRGKAFLMAAAVAMMAASVGVEFFADVRTNEYLRHNSPLWLPVFMAGICYARLKAVPGYVLIRKYWLYVMVLITVLWLWSTVSAWLWVLSPLLVLPIFGFVCIPCCEVAGGRGWLTRLSVSFSLILRYLGSISAGLFVCHPVVRVLALKAIDMGYGLLMVTLDYTVVCVIVAAAYNYCYKRVMQKLLSSR